MGIVERIKETEAENGSDAEEQSYRVSSWSAQSKDCKAQNTTLRASKSGDGFEVTKYGHGRVALIGFPSVGKSTLLTMLTGTNSEAASYEFTTLRELEAVGLRLNKRPPQIYFKKKKTGGISFNTTAPLTHIDEKKLCYQILHEYKIHNAEVLFREDATVDDFIDVIEGNRKYIKSARMETAKNIIQCSSSFFITLNLDRLLARMWDEMGLVRVYSKPQGQQPDFDEPFVLSADRGGCTVEDFCNHVHRTLVKDMKYALVWGTSARHYPQNCGLIHRLEDEDVVQIVKKKKREEGGRGRFKTHSNPPTRIADGEKKAPLKQ
ncbi:hypothetical protein AALP_AA2G160000 [Arabis alpina]|uniref:TGS domain-containing protein n=1 Tax=Arabis alpina TaxID=50452 RepID=A0A087HHT5_ARAAL|nr:hypothetical protein AALP_AA2G160000 [Arabis alpina]